MASYINLGNKGFASVVNGEYVDKTGLIAVIIDEWDAICREFAHSEQAMGEYVNLLRRMFKSVDAVSVFAGVRHSFFCVNRTE